MAIIDCNFHSVVLKTKVNVRVALPQKIGKSTGTDLNKIYALKKYRVLYLLHGITDDYTCWSRHTNIERYAERENILVVMPSVSNSFYCNMKHGLKYYDFIVEELPRFIQMIFPVSTKKEDTFIAGLSMGGYGALKIALKNPHRFAAVASLSGALDIIGGLDGLYRMEIVPEDIFGDCRALEHSDENLYYLLSEKSNNVHQIPPMYLAVGYDDFMYEANVQFNQLAKELMYDITFIDDEGHHEWAFWDKYIQEVIKWISQM